MNEQLIRELAITGGIYDCIRDPYDKLKNGDPYSSVMPDLERFAKKIILECMNAVCDPRTTYLESMTESSAMYTARERIRKHFGG